MKSLVWSILSTLSLWLVGSDTELTGASIVVETGMDTTLAQFGLFGPDTPHGVNHPEGAVWEYDLEDLGGQNQGLIWFDIPDTVLAGFNNGEAILSLHVVNSGDAADLYRTRVDWLDLGDTVTWNNVPGGPGMVVGRNVVSTSNARFPENIGSALSVVPVDVSADVAAWASGEPNYGWAFLPRGPNGTTLSSFESVVHAIPRLTITPGTGVPPMQAGDADQDLDFDQLDIVKVQIAAKYRTGQSATWGEGDWDGAPGGRPGDPPPGDGLFDELDIISALRTGLYGNGPYGATARGAPKSSLVTPHLGISRMRPNPEGAAYAHLGEVLGRGDLAIVHPSPGTRNLPRRASNNAFVPEPSSAVLLAIGWFSCFTIRTVGGVGHGTARPP